MTISNTSRTAGPFIGNGVTKSFPFSYKIFGRDDLLVARTDTATGVETILTLDADYTVSLSADQNSSPGGVIKLVAPLAVGTTLAATSNVSMQQNLDLTNSGGFYPKAINDALDRIVIMIQQMSARVGLGALNVGAAAQIALVLNFITNVAAGTGAGLIGFIQNTAGAVWRSVLEKLRERISIGDYASAGPIGVGNADADTAAILAAVAAVKKAFYDKGAAKLHFPVPSVPYRLNKTIDLTEVWNLTISAGSSFFFQRFNGAVDPLIDLGLIQWHGSAGGTMMRLHFTFGFESYNVSLNGRGLAKVGIDVAPATSVGSVTRKVDMSNACVKNCDIGIRVGDLLAQTDNAPVNIIRPYISGCSSIGLLVSSGNASVNVVAPWFINNGYAPTTGNGLIADGDNIGTHMTLLAGFVGISDWTSDHDGDHTIKGACIYQTNGSLRVNGAWVDDPTGMFYKGSADRAIYLNGITHYDAGMTPGGTPTSIQYSGPQALVLESCYLYGNVEILPGNQASVIDLGTTFARAGAGFTGGMVTTFGGLSRTGKTFNNSLALSVGGDFPKDTGLHHSVTVWSDSSCNGLIRAMRGPFSYKVTEHLNNGQMFVAGNAYYDNDVGQWKAIKAAPCWRQAFSVGTEMFDSFTATAAGQVITWANPHGFKQGTGPNGMPVLTMGGPTVTWESAPPANGTWSRGSIVFSLAATAGGKVGWVCVAGGTPGTWKPFGVIDA